MTVAALIVALFFGGAMFTAGYYTPRDECKAACTVDFGSNMHEDQFCIDYRGNGTLYVWRDDDTEC